MNKSLKILMVGNSFSDDISYYVPHILGNLGHKNIEVANLYIGGCSLKRHNDNIISGEPAYEFRYFSNGAWDEKLDGELKSLEFGLKFRDWDIISLQQASVESGKEESYNEALTSVVEYLIKNATNSQVKLVWNMTWAYANGFSNLCLYGNDQMQMYNAITSCVANKIEGSDRFCTVVPAGTTIQNLRTSFLGDTLNRDGTHLSIPVGRFAGALAFVGATIGCDLDKLDCLVEGITAQEFTAIKECVKNALVNKYTVTNSKIK
ncbi:MAG: DUF4886 domain-containing protein [Clostridia bacterium]|nr:DUF4886 domain-containing protein [Clostridia bacterium]